MTDNRNEKVAAVGAGIVGIWLFFFVMVPITLGIIVMCVSCVAGATS